MITFSIIVPVYNTKVELLEKCFDSIAKQTYSHFECIIVDDGSNNESCINSLNEICKVDSRFKVFFLEHHGNSYARNYGVSQASNDYLIFVDSDDYISIFFLEEANELINQYTPDMVLGLVKAFDDNDQGLCLKQSSNLSNAIYINQKDSIGDVFDHILGNKKSNLQFDDGYVSGGPVARAIKTSIAKKASFPGGDLITEDVIWNCEMMSYLQTMVILPTIWYGYYHYTGSKSRRYYDNGIELFYNQIDAYCRYIKSYWPNRKNGLYMKLWQEISMYFRIYLNNREVKWSIRYKYYKDMYSRPEFVEMINNIDFSYEKRTHMKLIKSFTRSLIKHRIYLPTWFIWQILSKKAI